MPDLMGVALGVALSLAGFATMALGQDQHWSAVTGRAASERCPGARLLGLGLGAQAAVLPLLIRVQGGAFGSLLWALCMSAAALAVAFALAWRPAILRSLARCFVRRKSAAG
jgi:hypothetical protein